MLYNLKCHCGDVELEVETDLQTIKQCNCSICIRKNAKMCMVSKDSIQIIKGKESLTSYKFNTMIAEHFFHVFKHCYYPFVFYLLTNNSKFLLNIHNLIMLKKTLQEVFK